MLGNRRGKQFMYIPSSDAFFSTHIRKPPHLSSAIGARPAFEFALLQPVKKNSVLCHVSKKPQIKLVKYVLPFEARGAPLT